MAAGPRTGADACQVEAPTGGHAIGGSLSNRGPAAEAQPSQASGAVAYCASVVQAPSHPVVDPNFGLQTTASGAMFVDQSRERRSESRLYGDILVTCSLYPFGGEGVSSSHGASQTPTATSVQTIFSITLTSTAVTCTALGGPAYVPYVSGQPQGGIDVCPSRMSSIHVALCRTVGNFP